MNFFYTLSNAVGTVLGFVLWFFFDLFDSFVPAAFIFVIILKVISFPFEIKSRKAMAKNVKISQKTQELQKKYANDRQKLNEELAKLYEKEGVNPLGGCLPQLLPAIIFTGVYGAIVRPLTNLFHVSSEVLNSSLEVLNSIPDLSGKFNSAYSQLEIIKIFPQVSDKLTMFTPEQISDILDFNKGFNFLGLDLFAIPMNSSFTSFAWIWPVLSALTMWISTFVMQKMNDAPQQAPGCAKFMPYALPLVFVAITLYAPAALGVYYTILNLISIVQVIIMAKFYGPKAIEAREEAARIARLELNEANEVRINSPRKVTIDSINNRNNNKKNTKK